MKLLEPIQVYEGDGRNPRWDCYRHGDSEGRHVGCEVDDEDEDDDGNSEGNGHGFGEEDGYGCSISGLSTGDGNGYRSSVAMEVQE